MRNNTTLAKKIKAIREKNKLSVQEFARIIGISRQHVYSLEKGINSPNFRIIETIANKFNVPISFFYNNYSNDSNNKEGV